MEKGREEGGKRGRGVGNHRKGVYRQNERYQEEEIGYVRDKNNDTNHLLKDTFYVPYRSFLAVTIGRSAATI